MSLRINFAMNRPEAPLIAGVRIEKDWYLLLVNIYNAVTQGLSQKEEAVTVEASPFVYRAVIRSQVFVSGGTVSAVEYSRDGTTYYDVTGAPLIQMAVADFLRFTYTVAPTVVAIPI